MEPCFLNLQFVSYSALEETTCRWAEFHTPGREGQVGAAGSDDLPLPLSCERMSTGQTLGLSCGHQLFWWRWGPAGLREESVSWCWGCFSSQVSAWLTLWLLNCAGKQFPRACLFCILHFTLGVAQVSLCAPPAVPTSVIHSLFLPVLNFPLDSWAS